MVAILRIVNAENGQPKDGNARDSEQSRESMDVTDFRRFKTKAIRFIIFKNEFNRTETITVVLNSFSSVTIGKNK